MIEQPFRFTAAFRFDPCRLRQCREQRLQGTFSDREADDLVCELGGLAVWILADDLLQQAICHRERRGRIVDARRLRNAPHFSRLRGACHVLCALEPDQVETCWPLREGFVQPLLWRNWFRDRTLHEDNTGRLPPDLQRIALDIRDHMHGNRPQVDRSQAGHWELVLNVDRRPEAYDLSAWEDFSADSGWAALATGWLMADRGGQQDNRIAVSAAWKPGEGLTTVERLTAKGHACHRHHVETLHVTHGQDDVEGLDVICAELPNHRPNPLDSLWPLLKQLLVEPDVKDKFSRQGEHYQALRNLLNLEADARAFYRERILPAVAASCRDQIPPEAGELLQECRLITVISESPELVELVAEIFRPRDCLLLYTQQTAAWRDEIRERVREQLGVPEIAVPIQIDIKATRYLEEVFDTEGLDRVRRFVRQAPQQTIVDLKPGPKTVSAALEQLARKEQAWAYILQNVQVGLRGIQPGRESPFLYRPE